MEEHKDIGVETESKRNKSFFKINKNLVMLKITLFFLYGGKSPKNYLIFLLFSIFL